MTTLKEYINKIEEEYRKTKFAREGGSCFECCDYETMDSELWQLLSQSLQGLAEMMVKEIRIKEKTEYSKMWEYEDCLLGDYGEKQAFNSSVNEISLKIKQFLGK